VQVTTEGLTNLSLLDFAFRTDHVVNCSDGFGIFPVRVEIRVKPTFMGGESLKNQYDAVRCKP